MKFSSSYKKRPPQQRAGKKRKKTVNKKVLCIILAVVLAVGAIVGTIFAVKHYQKTHPASGSAFESVSDSSPAVPETTEPTTATPEPTTELINGVSVSSYTATMYSTTVTLNVRSAPSKDSDKLGMVGQETPLSVTGKCANGWYRIDYNGGVGFVSGDYVAASQDSTQAQNADAPYLFKVNRTQNVVIAYAKDANGEYTVPYKAMTCSVGVDGKTPTGTFRTPGTKYDWRLLSGNVYGQYATRINGPYLFHSVPYFTKSKSDLEYEEYNKLGQPASLGCVRLSVEDAKWIHANCPEGTTVVIYDSDKKELLVPPAPIRIDIEDSRRGWDPTDPDSNNPWKQ